MADFHLTGATIATITVTIYLLGFALGSLLIALMSELYGRLIIYQICTGLFFGCTFTCALSTNVGMFPAFRFLNRCAGSAPLTMGPGTVADAIPQEKQGAAMAGFAVRPLLGPAIRTVMGCLMALEDLDFGNSRGFADAPLRALPLLTVFRHFRVARSL